MVYKFLPKIWMGKILVPLYDKIMAYNPKLNTDYEGEILQLGDLVRFRPKVIFVTHPYKAARSIRASEQVQYQTLTIDKGVYVSAFLPDVVEAQADLNSLDRYCRDMADKAFEEMKGEIPKGPALFALQVFEAEYIRAANVIGDKIRMLVAYGYKHLDPFRVATEIIGKAAAQGKDIKEIIVELDRAGF